PPRSWLYGLVFGLVYFGVHLSWIFLFGWMAWSGLVVFLALNVSVGTLVAGAVGKHRWAPLLVAGAWVGVELMRERWPFGGYPWGAVGTTQGTVPGVRWFAGVVGVYGISFLVVFASATIALAIVRGHLHWPSIGVVVGVLGVLVLIDVSAFGSPPEGRPLRVAVVQGNVPRPPTAGQNATIVESHLALTESLLEEQGRVDVVVWPESSIANSARDSGIEAVKDLAVRTRTPFLVGRSYFTQEEYFNQVSHVTASGRLAGAYTKRHPVPFGEYVPIGFLRDAVGTLQSRISVDQKRGTTATVFDIGGHPRTPGVEGAKIATPICFESVFPRDFLDYARNGTELFVLSTNNTSFERSYAAQQHIAHTRMRALETRQWVVQAALAGISAAMGPDGSISHATDLFVPAAFVADVRTRSAHSLYAKTGDLFASIWAGLAGLAFLIVIVRRRPLKGELESSS
ncbi:MAG: apolipoprotein N-acyltransferase, partial [Actinomycetota bacterium]